MQKEVSFRNTEKAFVAKNKGQLTKTYWLFKLMGSPLLVRFFSKLTVFAIKIGLPIRPLIKHTIFEHFCGGESLEETQDFVKKLKKNHVGSILDYSVEGKESEEDFEKTKDEVIRIIKMAKGNDAIPYTSLKLTGMCRFGLLEKLNENAALSPSEEKEKNILLQRLEEIAFHSKECNVPVYVDAEESWIQEAIDRICEDFMERHNSSKAVILTTVQMYRWDRLDYLKKLIEKACAGNYIIGVKLVRGAYMEKENARALEKGYRSPIQPDKRTTDKDYDEAITLCLKNIDLLVLCAGTHNEASTLHLLNTMKSLKIENDHPNVYFSQLYGMSDNITFNLADAGYNVTKYVPYGPIKSVIPYLIRRANENTAIAGQMSRELKLIVEEKERRKHARMLTQKV